MSKSEMMIFDHTKLQSGATILSLPAPLSPTNTCIYQDNHQPKQGNKKTSFKNTIPRDKITKGQKSFTGEHEMEED